MFRFKSIKIEGVTVDEVDGMTLEQGALLAGRGLVFATAFTRDGQPNGGSIIAASLEEAERIAGERGLGEEIVGFWAAAISE